MSFRLRLILAFAALGLLQALLFTAVAYNLQVHGLDREAGERLRLIAESFRMGLGPGLWPPREEQGAELWGRALEGFSRRHQLASAALALPGAWVGSQGQGWRGGPEALFASDGLVLRPQSGTALHSGLLFRDEQGRWTKVLWAKPDPSSQAWLRLEAGEAFLGEAPRLRRRLIITSAVLGLPLLLVGVLLAFMLSRRARSLLAALSADRPKVGLSGADEFAQIGAKVDAVRQALDQERAAREAEGRTKLDQARSLAWGVAHEMRNPLGAIALNADLLKRKSLSGADPAVLAELAGRVRGEVARMEEVVASFLEFSRKPELSPQACRLEDLVAQASEGVEPKPLLTGSCPAALVDPGACRVVLANLLRNAAEACGPGGRVELRLSQVQERCSAQVWDSGPPVPEELRPKLFSPFATGKAKGTGLGLATSQSLVQAMGGSLKVGDDWKTFVLELPAGEA